MVACLEGLNFTHTYLTPSSTYILCVVDFFQGLEKFKNNTSLLIGIARIHEVSLVDIVLSAS